jgi:putative transposase
MARMARVVASGVPHHITQRGNRRQPTFLCEDDYRAYLDLMADFCAKRGVQIWAYCLMPNHVHLIAVPESAESLSLAIGEAHRRYTRRINFREDWRGYLWQGRFSSYPMDDRHVLAAARYIELNPVRSKLVIDSAEYPWSSARAHLTGRDDVLVRVQPLLAEVGDWSEFLAGGLQEDAIKQFRSHERTGRPLGDRDFVKDLERRLKRSLEKRKPGPKSPLSFGDTKLN